MSFRGLLNQKIILYNKTSYDAYGREVVGNGTYVMCRFQRTTERKLLDNGNIVLIVAVCYVPPDTTVATDDRIIFDGAKYKVFGKYDAIIGNGEVHHIKLELIKWQE